MFLRGFLLKNMIIGKNNKLFKIYITHGAGEGKTDISAFDAALMKAGIANYNLIYLSSVIPKGTKKVKPRRFKFKEKDYGNRLYVVIARCDQDIFGREAWAGLGWVQDKEGRGVFVEHKAENEAAVIRLIKNSLEDMKKSRSYKYGKINYLTSGIKCKNKPVCALVAAVYKSEKWEL